MSVKLLGVVAVSLAPAFTSACASSVEPCSGHQLLSQPRAEGSCLLIRPQTYVAPDKGVRALVFPADVSLNTTPDMESLVVIRSDKGETVDSKNFSSPRGMNGRYVEAAKWSPDSQYFAFSLMSSGGHSPWSHPIWVYSRKQNAFVALSDLMNGAPTISGDFHFSGANTLIVSTWKQQGAIDNPVPATVDLARSFPVSPTPD